MKLKSKTIEHLREWLAIACILGYLYVMMWLASLGAFSDGRTMMHGPDLGPRTIQESTVPAWIKNDPKYKPCVQQPTGPACPIMEYRR